MEQVAAYTLRPVQEADEALLLELYASTRADELALVPWDASQKGAFVRMQFLAQLNHYRAYFPDATHEIIETDGGPVGRLYVHRPVTGIHILDVTLLPQARGRGVGTQLLLDLMREADKDNKPLSIYVESFNRSLTLFQRLGFVKTEENGASWLMVRHAGLQ